MEIWIIFFSVDYLLITKTLDDWIISLNFIWNIGQNHFNKLGNESFEQYLLKPLKNLLNHFNRLIDQQLYRFWTFIEKGFNKHFNRLVHEYFIVLFVKGIEKI